MKDLNWWLILAASMYAVYHVKKNSSQYPASLAVAVDIGWVAGTLLVLTEKAYKAAQAAGEEEKV